MATLDFRILKVYANWRGWDIQKKKTSDLLETHLRRLFTNSDFDLVVDCGANFGQFQANVRRAGFAGNVLSVEPTSKAFAALQQKSGLDARWQVERCALGEVPGTAMINVSAKGGELSSLLPSGFAEAREEVSVKTLGSLFAEKGISPEASVFLKSDTQGFDLKVLMGALPVMSQIKAIMVELSVLPLYAGMAPHWEVLDFLKGQEFEPFGFSTISRTGSGRLIEYDGLFVRKGWSGHMDRSEI